MLNDAFLHLVQPIMISVKDTLRVIHVEIVLSIFVPRQAEQSLQIVELHVIVWRLGIRTLQLLHLFLKKGSHIFIPLLLGSLGAHLLNVLVLHTSPKLILDVLHLLHEEVLALLLVDFFFCAHLDVLLEFRQLHFSVKDGKKMNSSLLQRVLLQQLNLFTNLKRKVRADIVDDEDSVVDILQGERGVLLRICIQTGILHAQILTVVDNSAELAAVFRRQVLVQSLYKSCQIGTALHNLVKAHPLHSLKNDCCRLIGHLKHSHHPCGSTCVIKVILGRVLRFR